MMARSGAAVAVAKPERVVAPKVVMLTPDGFANDWPGRPKVPVPVGVRLCSLEDIQFARAEASRVASEMHEPDSDERNWLDAFNDAIMRLVVARATCQPDDVSQPYWDVADENVKLALSEGGVIALWEAYDALKLETDQLSPQADDEDLSKLVEILTDGSIWAVLDVGDAARVRRQLRRALDALLPTA